MGWRWLAVGYVGTRVWTRYRAVRTTAQFLALAVLVWWAFR